MVVIIIDVYVYGCRMALCDSFQFYNYMTLFTFPKSLTLEAGSWAASLLGRKRTQKSQ